MNIIDIVCVSSISININIRITSTILSLLAVVAYYFCWYHNSFVFFVLLALPFFALDVLVIALKVLLLLWVVAFVLLVLLLLFEIITITIVSAISLGIFSTTRILDINRVAMVLLLWLV